MTFFILEGLQVQLCDTFPRVGAVLSDAVRVDPAAVLAEVAFPEPEI